jgi:hypothetical protein
MIFMVATSLLGAATLGQTLGLRGHSMATSEKIGV